MCLIGIVDAPPISKTSSSQKPKRTGLFGYPFCKNPVDHPEVDENGYQYGKENGKTCVVKTPPLRPTPSNVCICFFVCTNEMI